MLSSIKRHDDDDESEKTVESTTLRTIVLAAVIAGGGTAGVNSIWPHGERPFTRQDAKLLCRGIVSVMPPPETRQRVMELEDHLRQQQYDPPHGNWSDVTQIAAFCDSIIAAD